MTRGMVAAKISSMLAVARGRAACRCADRTRDRSRLLLGVLPGGGATLASFALLAGKKKFAHAAAIRQGSDRGRRCARAANNAAAQTSFIPMLTLGLPSTAVMAMIIGAMVIHAHHAGPAVMTTTRNCSGA